MMATHTYAGTNVIYGPVRFIMIEYGVAKLLEVIKHGMAY
jgi:hypothetical protein